MPCTQGMHCCSPIAVDCRLTSVPPTAGCQDRRGKDDWWLPAACQARHPHCGTHLYASSRRGAQSHPLIVAAMLHPRLQGQLGNEQGEAAVGVSKQPEGGKQGGPEECSECGIIIVERSHSWS